ncbi:MAG: diguanylate cyclase [Phycisphaerales bacterium]|nr:diguanylate cyclase [Phycisphaerales bacterium]
MTQPLTVLAIDDDAGDAAILHRNLLQVPDVTVEFVHHRDAASGFAELQRRKIDLTFVDYQLGALDGLNVIESIRGSGNVSPVIVLTGHGDEYIAAKVTRAGADDYLVKGDLSPAILEKSIAGALARFNQRELASRAAASAQAHVQQLESLHREFRQASRTDPLTAVFHRAALTEIAALEHSRARRYDCPYAVLMIDLDHFDLYNHSQGQLMGDRALQQVANCIVRTLRSTDIVGRYGGEEFLAILPEANASDAEALAQKVCSAIELLALPHPDSPTADYLTASIGVGVLNAIDDWETIIHRADEALYAAKNLGRNRVCVSQVGVDDTAGTGRRCVNVLSIDDDAGDAEILRRTLASIATDCFNFLHVTDAESATEVLAAQDVDVVFLDQMLGSVNGLEVLRALRAAGQTLPIIAFTGQRNEYIATELMSAGADDYLVKADATTENVRRAIDNAIARRQRHVVEQENRGLLRELREKNAELQNSNARLADLCETAHEFVDNVSHEFRTPLTVIKEFTSIMLDGLAGETTPEQQEYLAIVLHRSDDLATMIDDMLDISKLEAGVLAVARRAVRPEEILDRVRTTLERKATAVNVNLALAIPDELPELYCDPEKIGRVLINLTVNALKFSPAESTVRVWADVDDGRGEVRFGVTDHGPGIDDEKLASLFERFKQLDGGIRTSTRGFGLGLNIAKELVHLNFGTIDVRSTVGEGSTFSFTVPTSAPAGIIGRCLDRVARRPGAAAHACLVEVRAPQEPPAALAGEIDRFLQHQVRRCDLLFPTGPDRWILVTSSDTVETRALIERINTAIRDANRNRPGESLPELTLNIAGCWQLRDERAALIAAFEQLAAAEVLCHA